MANIAIMTNFHEFNPGYSLTGIVKDQVEMLTRYGNTVFLFVSEKYKGNDFDNTQNVILCADVPAGDLTDYQSKADISAEHKMLANRFTHMLKTLIPELGIDFVFTHDLIFTGWNLPYALGIQALEEDEFPNVGWLHWVHSIPSGHRDWWCMGDYPANHRIAYPNKSDQMRVAEAFSTQYESVRIIPHIKDMRTFFDFRPETREIIDMVPSLMSASFIQVYPASTDRLEQKRVDMVIKIFGYLKGAGHTVCLFIANQWATGRQRKEDIQKYKDMAMQFGLLPGRDVIFSSDLCDGKYETGLPREILRELMMLANLFVYPTREETFGLCLPEMSLASGALCVLNRSLKAQIEVSTGAALYFEFGSYENLFEPECGIDTYLYQVAMIVLGRFTQNESILHKTYMRQRYNMDRLYRQVYSPIIFEIRAM